MLAQARHQALTFAQVECEALVRAVAELAIELQGALGRRTLTRLLRDGTGRTFTLWRSRCG